MVELRTITENNFIDAFHLKLAPGQEKNMFLIRYGALHRHMFTETSVSRLEYTLTER